MKNLIFVLIVLVFASCDNIEVPKGIDPIVKSTGEKVGSGPQIMETKPFSNPAIIYGSDFGNFFRTMYKHGNYDEMIKFTSKESLDEFGEDEVRDFYKNKIKFGYKIGKLLSSDANGDYITLNYNGDVIATKTVIRIIVKIENDSCKIVLPNKLKNFPS